MRVAPVLLAVLFTLPLVARDWDAAPVLPNPAGTTEVPVANEAELQTAVQNLQSNQIIVLAQGTYALTNTLWLGGGLSNVGLRGATGDPADVVLLGAGMNNQAIPHGIHVAAVNGILIADLTIREVYYHPIQLAGEQGAHAPHIYNCRLIDAGEQFIKGSSGQFGVGCDEGLVEYTLMEYTSTCRDDYTNGIDIIGGKNWRIRHNLFRRILAFPGSGLAGPAVLMWGGSRDTICESNRFEDCERGIHFGLVQRSGFDHSGGVIRNNVFVRSAAISTGDVGIGIWDSPDTACYNNTVWFEDGYPNAIEYRFATTTGVDIRGNLSNRAVTARNGATGTVADNLENAQASWFVNAGAGDLQLAGNAPALDMMANVGASDDFEGMARPQGSAPDAGAYELGSGNPNPNPNPTPNPTPTPTPNPTPTPTPNPSPTPNPNPTVNPTPSSSSGGGGGGRSCALTAEGSLAGGWWMLALLTASLWLGQRRRRA